MTLSFISCLYGKKQKEEIYINVEDPYNLYSKELQNHLRGVGTIAVQCGCF